MWISLAREIAFYISQAEARGMRSLFRRAAFQLLILSLISAFCFLNFLFVLLTSVVNRLSSVAQWSGGQQSCGLVVRRPVVQ